MNSLIFTIAQNGFIAHDEGIIYTMTWVDSMLKVVGQDTCYYLLETARGLEQANCALTTFTLLIGN